MLYETTFKELCPEDMPFFNLLHFWTGIKHEIKVYIIKAEVHHSFRLSNAVLFLSLQLSSLLTIVNFPVNLLWNFVSPQCLGAINI